MGATNAGTAAATPAFVPGQAEPDSRSMNRGTILTVTILFAIAIGIYFGFIYLVGNAGG